MILSKLCNKSHVCFQMPVELADRIDAVDDIDVFMHDFVEDKDALTNVTNVKNTRIRKFKINFAIFYYAFFLRSTVDFSSRYILWKYFTLS